MNDETNKKLDAIIELLEEIRNNTNPLSPWNEDSDIKSAAEGTESATKEILKHLRSGTD